MIKNAQTDEMTTLSGCINKLVREGYTDELKPADNGMILVSSKKLYKPGDVKITNFYRFEGASNPDDNAILYAIETNDGHNRYHQIDGAMVFPSPFGQLLNKLPV